MIADTSGFFRAATCVCLSILNVCVTTVSSAAANRVKLQQARDLGIQFDGQPGRFNAITDVPGIEVGQVTLISGSGLLKVGEGPGSIDPGYPRLLSRQRPLSGKRHHECASWRGCFEKESYCDGGVGTPTIPLPLDRIRVGQPSSRFSRSNSRSAI